MRKKRIMVSVAVLLLLFLISCRQNEPFSVKTSENLVGEGQFNESVDLSAALSEDKLKAATDFAALLFEQYADGKEDNPVLSPLSAYIALAMTSNGAKGETLSEMKSLLCGHLSISDVNNLCSGLIADLQQKRGSTTLRIANSLWVRNDGFSADKNFTGLIGRHYGADMYAVDFADVQTPDDVNGWIFEKTEGLIPKMLDRIDPDAVMLLVNTLYLKARWQQGFDPNDNFKDDFTAADGRKVTVEYMTSARKAQYIENDHAQGVVLPYDDGRLAFIALKPKTANGLRELGIDAEWIRSLGTAPSSQISFSLPKFEIEYETLMNDNLKEMGMVRAFSEEQADFSNLGTSSGGNIYINRVLQKVKIKVHEKGTEAAAATVVEAMDASAPIVDLVLRFDSPFLYLIADMETGLPLFIGRLDHPEK